VHVPEGRTKPWGTGQALLLCRDVVDGLVAVINADDFYGPAAYRILHDYLVTAQDRDGVYDYCMVGYLLRNTLSEQGHVARGICTADQDGTLVRIDERTHIEKHGDAARYTTDGGATWFELSLDRCVSMNMWGFTPSIFGELEALFQQFLHETANLAQGEFYLPEAVNALIQAGKARVQVLPTEERWVGMTYRADKPAVEEHIAALVRQGVYPEKLWR
jgi:hypothetical protein